MWFSFIQSVLQATLHKASRLRSFIADVLALLSRAALDTFAMLLVHEVAIASRSRTVRLCCIGASAGPFGCEIRRMSVSSSRVRRRLAHVTSSLRSLQAGQPATGHPRAASATGIAIPVRRHWAFRLILRTVSELYFRSSVFHSPVFRSVPPPLSCLRAWSQQRSFRPSLLEASEASRYAGGGETKG